MSAVRSTRETGCCAVWRVDHRDGIHQLQAELEKGFDIVFSIGTTSVFPYIQAPIYMAKSAGNVSVEINPSETTISHVVDYRLAIPAGLALEEIWKSYQAGRGG